MSEASVVVVGGRAAGLSSLRSLRVVLPSGEAYWTVVDQHYEVVEAADGFLRDLRFGADRTASTTKLYKVRTDGTDLQRLTAWGHNASAPDWSPSGNLIAFDASDNIAPGERGDIHVMQPDGSGKTTLTDTPILSNAGHDLENFAVDFANNPVWSPDATKIAFTHWLPTGPTEIATINSDGSAPTTLVDGDFFQNKPDWGTHP